MMRQVTRLHCRTTAKRIDLALALICFAILISAPFNGTILLFTQMLNSVVRLPGLFSLGFFVIQAIVLAKTGASITDVAKQHKYWYYAAAHTNGVRVAGLSMD